MHSVFPNRVAPSVMYIILGLLLMLCPIRTMELLCTFVGWILVIYGGAQILMAFLAHGRDFVNRSLLVAGLVPVALGIIVILSPGFLTAAVPVCFGITMTASGITNAYLAERGRFSRWKTSFIINVLIAAGGVFIIFCHRDLVRVMAVCMGLTMIMTGLAGLLSSHK